MATVTTVTTKARRLLRDVVDGNHDWTDNELIGYVDEGQKEVHRFRPDSVIIDTDTVTPVYTLTELDELTDTLQVSDRFITNIVNYVVGKALASLGAKHNPSESQAFFQKFYEPLQ